MAQVAVTGAGGRMGRALIEATLDTERAHLIGATVREGSSLAGVDAAELVGRPRSGAPVVTDLHGARWCRCVNRLYND
jgi:Dihydrodipicolinate reductase